MVSYLTSLTWLSFILLAGVLISFLSLRLNIPQLIILIFVGIGLGQFGFVSFSSEFLTTFGLFALIMIIFESSSEFKIKEINKFSPAATKLAIFFLLINIFFLSFFTNAFFLKEFTTGAILMSMLFASLMSGTDPSTVLTLLKNSKAELTKLLEFESIINTPITVIFPIIILFWFQGKLLAQDIAIFFIRGIVAGVGTGMVVGIISFRLMRKRYVETLSPLLVIAIALVSYTLAEAIGGNGVLSVTALGIVFGMFAIKQKESIEKFIDIFSHFLTIVLFVLLGLFIKLPTNIDFLLKSLALFGVSILLRFIAVGLAFWESKINLKERLFLALNTSKGVATATVAFILLSILAEGAISLSHEAVNQLHVIVNLTFLFILYSLILASVTVRFAHFFIGEEAPSILEKNKPKKTKKALNNTHLSTI